MLCIIGNFLSNKVQEILAKFIGISLLVFEVTKPFIYIYGFDLFSGDKLHYMDKKTKENDNNQIAHNTTKEKQFMKFLINKYNIQEF